MIDTSALIAIIKGEPERDRFLEIIADADGRLISGVTLIEARLVTFGWLGEAGTARLTALLEANGTEIVPFDAHQADVAFEAFKAFGKGINSKSRLNMADSASYALAKTRGVALLYKGDDFAATDIRSALSAAPPNANP